MASLDARRTPLPTLWKPTPIFLCPFVANNEVLRILINISFPRRHPYFSLFIFIQVSEQDYTSSASFLRALYQKGVCVGFFCMGPGRGQAILPVPQTAPGRGQAIAPTML